MDKFLTVLFEGRNGVEREFVILGNLSPRARDGHRGEGFVRLEEVFCERVWDCDEVGFKIVRVADEEGGRDDSGERFVREIAAGRKDALALVVGEGRKEKGYTFAAVEGW